MNFIKLFHNTELYMHYKVSDHICFYIRVNGSIEHGFDICDYQVYFRWSHRNVA